MEGVNNALSESQKSGLHRTASGSSVVVFVVSAVHCASLGSWFMSRPGGVTGGES